MTDYEAIADTFDELAEANRDRAEDPDADVNDDYVAGAASAYDDAASYLRHEVDGTDRRPNARIVASDGTPDDDQTAHNACGDDA